MKTVQQLHSEGNHFDAMRQAQTELAMAQGADSGVVSNAEKVMDKAPVIEKTLSALALAGISDAERIIEAQSKAEYNVGLVARKVLQDRAAELKGVDLAIREYLSGYRTKFPKSGNERASEARKVFDAYAKDSSKVTAFEGTYHDWIKLCREVVGVESNPRGSGRKAGSKSVTAKTMEAITERLKIASGDQAATIAERAINQIIVARKGDWEVAIVEHLVAMAAKLDRSEHPIYRVIAAKVALPCQDLLDRLAAEAAKETAASSPVETQDVPVPEAATATSDTELDDTDQALLSEMEVEETQQQATAA